MNNIITKEQAIAQGSSPAWLRVLANGIERLGTDWMRALKGAASDQQVRECKARANENYANARALRNLAREVEKAK